MQIADLHIHSRYSRATSRDCCPEQLDFYARRKGITILGTGDFTHPAWRQELSEKLLPAEDGLYRLREELAQQGNAPPDAVPPRFVVSGEISCIYKKDGKTRKVHNLILLPGLEEARSGWRRSATCTPTAGPSWGWTAATCSQSPSKPARRPFSSRPTSGRRIFRSSAPFRALRRSQNVSAISLPISTHWKPAFPPTRR